ncbi:MAG: class I SAM-dependent methyltransferase [Marmoricola sp.]
MPSMSVIEQGFCRSAPWRGFARRVILPWALHGLEPQGELLELGAGSGAMADGTARTFPDLQLTVTDIDPAMVAAARKHLSARPNVRVERADVTDLPFADSSFEVVTSYLMLHHVVEWRRALSEASRVLRPGGVFVGYDLAKTRLATLIHVADRSPYRLIARHEIRPALVDAGLQDVHIRRALGGHVVQFTARKSEKSEG